MLARFTPIVTFIVTLVLSVLPAGEAVALDLGKSLSQYVHQSYGLEAGMPQISAVALAQTSDGYIWVGTQEGLARFDGVEFTVWSSENTDLFKDDNIVALAADLEGGGLWVATYGGGLLRFEGGVFRLIPAAPGLSDPRITALALGAGAGLWVGTPGGLAQVVEDKIVPILREGAPRQITALLPMASRSVFVASEDGLYLFEDDNFISLANWPNAPTTTGRSLYMAASGVVLIGTDTGLFGYTNERFLQRSLGDLGPQPLVAIVEDSDGNVWAGTENHGVNVLRGEELSRYPAADMRSKLQIAALLEDRERNIWIGTHNDGLKVLRDGTVTVFSEEEGLPTRMTLGVVDDLSGHIWVGSASGLTRISPSGEVRVFTTAQGLPSDYVLSLTRDLQGALWVGTRNAGLAKFRITPDEDGIDQLVLETKFSTANGMKSDAIYGIYEDYENTLWVATNGGGLHKIKDGQITVYAEAQGLSDDKVTSVLRDRNGDVWVGTDFGLDQFVNGDFEKHVRVPGFDGLRIMSLYLDPEDNLWVGTYGKGLRVIRGGVTAEITRKDGLFDDVVYVVVPDSRGNLWMTSNKGLGRLVRRDALDFMDKKIPKITCDLYGSPDGMRSREGLGGFMQSGWVTKDDMLWFSTVDGVIRVDPLLERGAGKPPLVSVQGAIADGEPFKAGAALPSGVRLVEFKYTALGFYAPERMAFEYRLRGFEEEWNHAKHRRGAFYTNLPPGSYTFEVMAYSASGTVSARAGTMAFEVKHAFYQTVWFYILSALCLVGALIGLLRLRTFQVKRREISTTKLAWQRAQSVLETQVDAIRALGDVLGKAIDRVNSHMNDLARAAREVAYVVSESEAAVREVGEAGIGVQENADQIVQEVRKSEKVSATGRITMLETATAIDRMRDDAAEVTRSSSSLLDSLAQVDRTISSVKEIAEKSKILAINASIEAVKAGRAGAGFGVVAREIKAMALQSKGATRQITTLLNMVRGAITEITRIGERSQKRTVAGVEMLSRSQDTVNSFNEAMGENLKLAHSIADAIKDNGSRLAIVLESFGKISTAAEVNREVSQEMLGEAAKLRDIVKGLTSLIEDWKSPELRR